jgi:lysyl-tRNA synthetase class 1
MAPASQNPAALSPADPRRELARTAKAWPFEEARHLVARLDAIEAKSGKKKEQVLFETGYGPSGLPHIGTFGEVARTTWVRRAFEVLTGRKTRLIAFSDDMDGLRKVPDNVPNADLLRTHLHKPLTEVPDPFGTHESFGAHNNARLRRFLDSFGFEYEFLSSTQCYRSGMFDAALRLVLNHYDAIQAIMLPTLGEERRSTYSPFLPICPRTRHVLQVPIIARDVAAGTITYKDEDGSAHETPITGGRCKLQWKVDWAMRWVALDVDYEMSGKDLIPSVELSTKIARALGAPPPHTLSYELFLDTEGAKISKSKGNGIAVEDWLAYAAPESLSLFMYQKPKTAKRLYFDIIPKEVDDYAAFLSKVHGQSPAEQLENPVWHIHGGHPPQESWPVSFALMLNLVAASNAETPDILWGFIRTYAPTVNPSDHPSLDRLVGYALRYYHDFVKPKKRYRAPTEIERAALDELAAAFDSLAGETDAETIQNVVYEIGKKHKFEPLRDWFKALYEVLFGESQGPRFGSFAAIYGVEASARLIRNALAGANLK